MVVLIKRDRYDIMASGFLKASLQQALTKT